MRSAFALSLLVMFSSFASAQLSVSIAGDGEVSFVNNGEDAQQMSGYTFVCATGCLDVDGWNSISSAALADPLSVIAGLGPTATAFIEANPMETAIAELNVAGVAVLQPGASWSIGKPFGGDAAQIAGWADSGILSADISADLGVFNAVSLDVVPEPSSFLLLSSVMLLAGLGRSRRR